MTEHEPTMRYERPPKTQPPTGPPTSIREALGKLVWVVAICITVSVVCATAGFLLWKKGTPFVAERARLGPWADICESNRDIEEKMFLAMAEKENVKVDSPVAAAPPETSEDDPGKTQDFMKGDGKDISRALRQEVESVVLADGDVEVEFMPLGQTIPNRTVTILNFWATWCGPCKEEFKDFEKFFAKSSWGDKVRFVPVAIDGDPGSNYLPNPDIEIPSSTKTRLVSRSERAVRKALQRQGVYGDQDIDALPVTIVLDCVRKARWVKLGALTSEASWGELRGVLDSLVGDLDSARCKREEYCGNGRCGKGENFKNCPAECPQFYCGDRQCRRGETCRNCPKDCCKCGDGICSRLARKSENSMTCPEDCSIGVGGDPTGEPDGKRSCKCGDGYCSKALGCSEGPHNCPEDCSCGDGKCNRGETKVSCPRDCLKTSKPKQRCGDGKCSARHGEGCQSCPKDCRCGGICKPSSKGGFCVGDNRCDKSHRENCGNSKIDCRCKAGDSCKKGGCRKALAMPE